MQKWLRRGLYASLTAGFVAGSVGVAYADDTTVVSPTVKSETNSMVGDNSILGGNGLSAPGVAPITGNDAAGTVIGGAVNAENVLVALGLLGVAHANGSCDSDDYVEVSGVVTSKSTSVAGDNSIGSGNAGSVPIDIPVTENKGAVTGIGGAVNGEDVTGVVGALGAASCGDAGNGDGGDPYVQSSSENTYSEDVLPGLPAVGSVSQLVNMVGVQDVMGLTKSLPVGNLLGLGLLNGAGLQGATDTVSGVVNTAAATAAPVASPVSELAVETVSSSSGSTTQASANSQAVASESAVQEHSVSDDTTVVAPTVKSKASSMAGDNSIGSGNSASVPIVVPVTGNDVSGAGIGGAVNGEDVGIVASVLGTATALLD